MERMSAREIGVMYDEQFRRRMRIARLLLRHLRDKKEVQLARKWLARVSDIKSPILGVKRDRNAFLAYLVKVLRDGVLSECLVTEPDTVCDPDNSLAFLDYPDDFARDSTEETEKNDNDAKLQFHSKWSRDHRTYVAVKPIPGRGALVYMAVSKKPGLENWDLPALNKTVQS